jgi:hypothetical protein
VRPALTALFACVLLAATPASARELWSAGEFSLGFSGSVRELAVVTRGTDAEDFEEALKQDSAQCLLDPPEPPEDCIDAFPYFSAFDEVGQTRVFTSLTRLRLGLDLRAGPHVSAEVVYDNELLAGTLNTFEAEAGDAFGRPPYLNLQGGRSSEHVRWSHGLYRGYLLFESRHFEGVIGRQRVPWGVGRLWNPIDRFNAIRPLALQSDQSAGIDAVLARWLVNGFTSLEAVFAPGHHREDHWYALRLHGVAWNVDYSLMAGVFDEAPTAGLDLAANLGDAAGRLEVVYANPRRAVWPVESARPYEVPDFWQVVVSVDYLFDVGDGLYALVEYLYNGNALGFGRGKAGPLLPFFERTEEDPFVDVISSDRFGGSQVVTRSGHLTGLELGYDLTPELRADLLVLADWDGLSATWFPRLRYSPLDWMELTLGAQLPHGRRLSEFGSGEFLGFLLADLFF